MAAKSITHLEAERNSAASLAARLANCQALLVKAVERLGDFENFERLVTEIRDSTHALETKSQLSTALSLLSSVRLSHAAHPDIPSQRHPDDALHRVASAA